MDAWNNRVSKDKHKIWSNETYRRLNRGHQSRERRRTEADDSRREDGEGFHNGPHQSRMGQDDGRKEFHSGPHQSEKDGGWTRKAAEETERRGV